MKIGYARVSTQAQDLSEQIEILKNEGCEVVYSEKYTGTKKERPQFQAMLQQLKEGDTLVVTKLDRFARSAEDAIHIAKELLNDGIKVHILNLGLVDNTPTGRLILTIMSGFAEFERDLIVERTQAGRAYAKANNPNFRDGRPPKHKKAVKDQAMRLLTEGHSYTEVAEMTGMSRATVFREASKRGLTIKARESDAIKKGEGAVE